MGLRLLGLLEKSQPINADGVSFGFMATQPKPKAMAPAAITAAPAMCQQAWMKPARTTKASALRGMDVKKPLAGLGVKWV
jgi:hypothetical protein